MSELKLPEIKPGVAERPADPRSRTLRYARTARRSRSFGLAFHRRYRARDGHAAEQTGFVTVVTYQRLAEVCGQYLKKGSAVLVEGRLQMREWAYAAG